MENFATTSSSPTGQTSENIKSCEPYLSPGHSPSNDFESSSKTRNLEFIDGEPKISSSGAQSSNTATGNFNLVVEKLREIGVFIEDKTSRKLQRRCEIKRKQIPESNAFGAEGKVETILEEYFRIERKRKNTTGGSERYTDWKRKLVEKPQKLFAILLKSEEEINLDQNNDQDYYPMRLLSNILDKSSTLSAQVNEPRRLPGSMKKRGRNATDKSKEVRKTLSRRAKEKSLSYALDEKSEVDEEGEEENQQSTSFLSDVDDDQGKLVPSKRPLESSSTQDASRVKRPLDSSSRQEESSIKRPLEPSSRKEKPGICGCSVPSHAIITIELLKELLKEFLKEIIDDRVKQALSRPENSEN